MKLNLNQKVKVKLTQIGKNHLIERHKKIYGRHANSFPCRTIKEDKYGYSTWQLWELMGVFGELMQYPTCNLPFETEIKLIE